MWGTAHVTAALVHWVEIHDNLHRADKQSDSKEIGCDYRQQKPT